MSNFKIIALVGCGHNPEYVYSLINREDELRYVVIDCYPGTNELEAFLSNSPKIESRILWACLETKNISTISNALEYTFSDMRKFERARINCLSHVEQNFIYKELINLDMIIAMAQRTLLNQLCFSDIIYKISIISGFWHFILYSYNVENIVFASAPHSFSDFILLEIANITKSIKKAFVYNQLFFDNYSFILEYKSQSYIKNHRKTAIGQEREVVTSLCQTLINVVGWKHNYGQRKISINSFVKEQKQHLLEFDNDRSIMLLKALHHRTVKYDLISTKTKKICTDYNYVYFPLHYQPECSTNPMGLPYYDHRIAIKEIRVQKPDQIIIIKEHPMSFLSIGAHSGPPKYIESNLQFRSEGYYDSLKIDDKIIIADRHESSQLLVKNASCIAGISGSDLLRGLLMQKEVVILSKISPLNLVNHKYSCEKIIEVLENLIFDAICHNCGPVGNSIKAADTTYLLIKFMD